MKVPLSLDTYIVPQLGEVLAGVARFLLALSPH